jgi:hypothetical protein
MYFRPWGDFSATRSFPGAFLFDNKCGLVLGFKYKNKIRIFPKEGLWEKYFPLEGFYSGSNCGLFSQTSLSISKLCISVPFAQRVRD